VLLHAVFGSGAQLVESPSTPGHTNHWNIETATLDQGLQSRKDFLICKIARGTKEHQSV
jgi:hypothetical protein